MTMPADPSVFNKAPRTVTPTQLGQQGTAPTPAPTPTPAPVTPAPTSVPTTTSTTPPPNGGYPSTPIVVDPATGQTTNGPTTIVGSAPDLDPTTGQPRTTVAGQNGVTIYNNADGSSVGVDPSGKIVWRRNANGELVGVPVVGAPDPSTSAATASPATTTTPWPAGGPNPADNSGQPGGVSSTVNGITFSDGLYRTSDGATYVTLDQANSHQQGLDVAGSQTFGLTAGLANIANSPAGNNQINDNNLVRRVQNQTSSDIAGISAGGALGQNALNAAADQATATGNAINNTATTQANNALARGDAGLATAKSTGLGAVALGEAAAQPLYGVGALDLANGSDARNTAASYAAATGVSLDEATQAIQRLQALSNSGDVASTQKLASFTGNNGTANQLGEFNPTATRTAGFTGSAGDATTLEGVNTNAAATGQLGAFNAPTATAPQLSDLNTTLNSTNRAANFNAAPGESTTLARTLNTNADETAALGRFQGTNGTADALAGVNTGKSATGNLLGFGGNAGTATDLRNVNTAVPGTGALNTYTGAIGTAGGIGSDQLERLDRIASGADIGPNAAEELLKKGADQNMSQAIALARSGRGAGASAAGLRQAQFQNAATEQGLSTDMAALRAQEAATARGQNLTAAQAAAGTATTLGGQKLQGTTSVAQLQQQAVQDKIGALVSAGGMTQKQADQVLSALTSAQQGQGQSIDQTIQALVASGQMTQAQSAQVLDAMKATQQGQEQAIAQKSANTVAAGQQEQTASQQQLDALKVAQAGELSSVTNKLNALVASGQMTQAAASQQLDALKAKQQGELTSISQTSTNVATAGQQRQVQAQQQLSALQSQQQADLSSSSQRLQALVSAGQMTQEQANQQLTAIKAAQDGQLAMQNVRVTAANAAAGAANTSGGVQADLAKSFATIGLNYDVNSGNVYNNGGQLIMSAEQVNSNLVQSGLSNQAVQGANAANITSQGVQALTNLTNTSVDAQKASATLGFQTSAAIASLSQAELSQLQGIVQSHDGMALQEWAASKNIALQVDQNNAQQTGAIFQALGTIVAGAALLSDVRSKTDIAPAGAHEWLNADTPVAMSSGTPLNPVPSAPPTAAMSPAKIQALLSLSGTLGNSFGRAIGSDEKGKKDKHSETFDDFLANRKTDTDFRAAKGYTYKYKDPKMAGAAPGTQYGPMAQDLTKTAAKDAVFMGPDKLLKVDPTRVVMPLMAAAGEQQRRLDRDEDVIAELVKLMREFKGAA